jgi:hypothetical protein
VPSWNLTPSLSLKRHVRSSTCSQLVARRGRTLPSFGSISVRRLGDVLLHDPADVGAAGVAGVDDVRLLGQHDGERALLGRDGGPAGEAGHEEECRQRRPRDARNRGM